MVLAFCLAYIFRLGLAVNLADERNTSALIQTRFGSIRENSHTRKKQTSDSLLEMLFAVAVRDSCDLGSAIAELLACFAKRWIILLILP